MYTNKKKIVNILGYKEFNLHSTLFYSIHTPKNKNQKKTKKTYLSYFKILNLMRLIPSNADSV